MKGSDRNKPCKCGSKIKAKYCYGKQLLECDVFFAEEVKRHDKREEAIFNYIEDIVREVASSFFQNDKKQYVLGARAQLIICFSFIDVLTNLICKYENLDLKGSSKKKSMHERQFKYFFQEFIDKKKNTAFKNTKFLQGINAAQLYHIRCSLVHWFGNGGLCKGKQITIATDRTPNKIIDQFLTIGSLILMPLELKETLINAIELIMNRLLSNIENANKDKNLRVHHVRGIDRCYQKFLEEGAISIKESDLQKIILHKQEI